MAQSPPQEVVSSAENSLEAYHEVSPDGCPRFRMPSGLLSLNGEVALGYLEFGHRPIPLIPDGLGSYYLRSTNPVRTATAGSPGVKK
jgi:hypothetical protein